MVAVFGVCSAGAFVCQGCSEANGDLAIENRSSRDIVIKYPHEGEFSPTIPAHSRATAIRDIQISGRPLYADVFDARTKKLLLKGPGDGETSFAEKGRVLIVFAPKGDDKSRPMRILP